MARDRANLRTDIWADDDWRDLSPGAQWLYMHLLTSATLNYVGIADWRPARIAAVSRTLTRDAVEGWGIELESARFIVTDDDTEEVFIRSFLRHDGALQNPNLWKSIGKDFSAVASRRLMRLIAHEMRRLRDENPDGWEASRGGSMVCPWGSKYLQTLLDTPSESLPTPGVGGGLTGGLTVPPPTTTATSTSTKDSSAPAVLVSEKDFETAWAYWPKKVERKKSLERFRAAARRRGVDVVTADIRRFGEAYARTTERQYVPALDVWLRNERWTDELPGTTSQPVQEVKRRFVAHAD